MFNVLANAASAVAMIRQDGLPAQSLLSSAAPARLHPAPTAPANARVIGWPEPGEGWKLAVKTGCFCALFWAVYWPANEFAASGPRFRVDMAFEAGIPFLPWASLIYISIVPLMLMAPFVMRSDARMRPLFCALCAELAIASLVFVAFPVELGYPKQAAAGAAAIIMDAAKQAALPYNLLPSLHVAFALTTAAALSRFGGLRWKAALWSWSVLIAASTLLTHQHHVADALAGALLSFVVMRAVYPAAANA